jgi:ABC-type glutathione transport system ATPase component
MTTERTLLTVEELSCSFYKRKDGAFHQEFILEPIFFELSNSEIIGLVGESGSGKTTVGRLITGALKSMSSNQRQILTKGNVVFFPDHDYTDPGIRKSLRYPVQMIYQDPKMALNEFMQVRPQVIEGAKVGYERIKTDLSRDDWITREVDELLDVMMLREIEEHHPIIMSGGQVRRLGVARILASQPTIIIADEPTASLDASTKNMVLNYLQQYAERRIAKGRPVATIIISHDLETISRYCHSVLVMKKGKLVEILTGDGKGIFSPKESYTIKLWEDNAFFAKA